MAHTATNVSHDTLIGLKAAIRQRRIIERTSESSADENASIDDAT
jgi:hypothetical protein